MRPAAPTRSLAAAAAVRGRRFRPRTRRRSSPAGTPSSRPGRCSRVSAVSASALEIGEQRLHPRHVEPAEKRDRRFAVLAWPRRAGPAARAPPAARRAGTFAARRPNVVRSASMPAADLDEVLRHRLAIDLAQAALEADGRDVMLAAAVRAAADLDVERRAPCRSAPAWRAGAARAPGRARATASPRACTTRRPGNW